MSRVPTRCERNRLLLAPVTALIALGLAGPAGAADWNVGVTNFKFTPKEHRSPSATASIWTFAGGGHTATANRGQPDTWDSDLKDADEVYEHTFTTPGRYQYVCTPHDSFMKGVIEVGEDAEADTVDGFKAKRTGSKRDDQLHAQRGRLDDVQADGQERSDDHAPAARGRQADGSPSRGSRRAATEGS